ncbi:hypothetical protein [Cellulomonas hominis]|uniref:hypothetical protein n=1 Tax=Cellulomonas hominis TaxID=156981 RepID=UPI001B95184E|nr:hypothetical protein [Cellulomonas hominis]VTR75676.1 hypothetical protein CHMI_00427 [Cellulomonas hominis]
MTVHVYVDESKAADYLLAATMVEPGRVPAARSAVRALVPPRQNRLHMRHEPDRRRRTILSALGRLDVATTLYRAAASPASTQIERRRACLARLVADVAGRSDRLVIESDETQDARDRRDLIELTRAAGCRDTLRYEHLRAGQEPLLSVPDVVAWSWARGGEWRRRASGIVTAVVDV